MSHFVQNERKLFTVQQNKMMMDRWTVKLNECTMVAMCIIIIMTTVDDELSILTEFLTIRDSRNLFKVINNYDDKARRE